MSKPTWTIQGNLLSSQPRQTDYREVAKHQVELNLLSLWEEMSFFEKLWLYVSYPFRGRP